MKRVVFLLAMSLFSAMAMIAGEPGAVDKKAPELAFTVPGQGPKLLSQYRGKVVVIEFIYTTCPHCQASTKTLNKFTKEFESKGLQVIDVAFNPNSDLLVENFVKDFQTIFPVGWAPREQVLTFLGVGESSRFVVPQMVMIDRKGIIRYQTPPNGDDEYEKVTKEETVHQRIGELLNSSAASSKSTASAGKTPRRTVVAKNGKS